MILKCGHAFHTHCISKRIETRWHTPRIFFTFCLCPLCKVWCEFPEASELKIMMIDLEKYLIAFLDMSMKRLTHEGKHKDKRLLTIGDDYYNKP